MLVRTALLALTTVLALAGCSGSDESSDAQASDPAPTAGVSCEYPEDAQGASKEVDPPPATATATGTVEVTLATSAGEIGLELIVIGVGLGDRLLEDRGVGGDAGQAILLHQLLEPALVQELAIDEIEPDGLTGLTQCLQTIGHDLTFPSLRGRP